jgi:hypothetical protein
MQLGHKSNKIQSLGVKAQHAILTLGNKNIYGNFNNTIRGNNGSGISSNHVMPAGHAPFYPLGMRR